MHVTNSLQVLIQTKTTKNCPPKLHHILQIMYIISFSPRWWIHGDLLRLRWKEGAGDPRLFHDETIETVDLKSWRAIEFLTWPLLGGSDCSVFLELLWDNTSIL